MGLYDSGPYKIHKIRRHKNGKYFWSGIGCRALCNYEYVLGWRDTGSIKWKKVTCKNCLRMKK